MPDTIEESLTRILQGLSLTESQAEFCDFTIAQQNEAMEAQGVAPSVKSTFTPVLGETITYIVAAVLINDNDEVLMMQEAKPSCLKKWYLPAGRMEAGENICDATKREVLEETGLIVELDTLLTVETAQGSWIRFVLTGKVVGGSLKTLDQADRESLQAQWIKDINTLSLRSTDITHLVDRGRIYKAGKAQEEYYSKLPSLFSHKRVLLRLVICGRKKSTNRLHVVCHELSSWHLPACEIHPTRSVHASLRKFMVELFGAEVPQHKPHGILSVEHDGISRKTDGVCITLLVAFRPPLEECPLVAKCVWHQVSKNLEESLVKKIINKNATLPLHVIR